MALDEALLERAAADPQAVPTLRFYSWERPAVTAGYFQDVPELVRRLRCREKSLEVIRRLTGGGMVFHGADLTFSLILKLPSPYMPRDVKDSYLKINRALMMGLKKSCEGLDFADCRTVPSGRGKGENRVCFEKRSCYDLLWCGKKVVGASQRRRDNALLHQSTVFLGGAPAEIEKNILEGFEKLWDVAFERSAPTFVELEEARAVEMKRYRSPKWAFRIP